MLTKEQLEIRIKALLKHRREIEKETEESEWMKDKWNKVFCLKEI